MYVLDLYFFPIEEDKTIDLDKSNFCLGKQAKSKMYK